MNRKACARNGMGVYRLGVGGRNVVTGAVLKAVGAKIAITFTETEYLVAKAQQLSLGFEGIAGRDWSGDYCRCKAKNLI